MTVKQGSTATIDFEARSVTGSRLVEVSDVQRDAPAGAVAQALAERLALPKNVPWSLRSRTRMLDDGKSIGEQLQPGERVTVTPKAHLG